MLPSSRLVCAGCGRPADPTDPAPFRCAGEHPGDEIDHVLRRELGPVASAARDAARTLFADPEPNPFLRYRQLLHSDATAIAAGSSDAERAATIRALDAAVAEVDGRGFRATPMRSHPALADALGLGPQGEVWVKDETGNVSGSHKARHFFGLQLWLSTHQNGDRHQPPRDSSDRGINAFDRDKGCLSPSEAPLAVASCGNAALAAAVVARAVGRRLAVFIPPDASPAVVERLRSLGADLAVCPRRAGESGDPCYLRYREAVAAGAVPFSCQGNENALVIEGGKTLAWEMVSDLLHDGRSLDHLVIQVGGGALASASSQALLEAHALGVLPRLPRLHTVQTVAAHPLERAYERVVARLIASPGVGEAAPAEPLARATWIRDCLPATAIADVLHYAATHRGSFMRPWESTPASVAHGILDDETYDWLAVLDGMLRTGGVPVLADEATLVEANRLAGRATGIAADETGTSGLAGALTLARTSAFAPGEHVALLFTGVRR